MSLKCRIINVRLHLLTVLLLFFFSEAEKQTRMAALLEKLHAKHNASRPWQETCKVVRQAMVRQTHVSVGENNLHSQSISLLNLHVAAFNMKRCLRV